METKDFIAIIAALLIGILLIACDPMPRQQTGYKDSAKWGKVTTQDVDIEECNAIKVYSCADVVFEQGDEFKVEIEGNEKALAKYAFDVEEEETDGQTVKWLVSTAGKLYDYTTPSIRIHVTAPTLLSIEMNGSGDFDAKLPVKFDNNLLILNNGAGDIDIRDLECKELNVHIIGSGDTKVKDLVCSSIVTDISGSGDLAVKNCESETDVNLNANGSGDIDGLFKAQNIFASALGSGDIEIKVDCDEITLRSEGSSDVEVEGHTKVLKRSKRALGNTTTKHLHADNTEWVE